MNEIRALLLTDVVDSTKLSEQLGDTAMAALWAAHDRVARDLLPVHNGLEIDKTDGFLMLFESVAEGLAYAVAYHRAIGALDPPIQARAGLHWGPVILSENAPADVARGAKPLEVDGLAKPTVARVMGLALGAQTLLTADAIEALGTTELRVESHGHWRMKGVSEPIELFEVGDETAPFTPPPDGAKVYRVVEQGDLWLPVKQVKHSLLAERDAFVGRQSDLLALARRLDGDARLVSVLGIGGTGKTRLVTRYGWTWLGDYPGGVWFCDLSEARSVEGIVSAVGRAMDVPLGKDDPVVQLGHAIAGRGRCLVLLDNFEQVARHADETLGHWLDRASEAQFVVTSREVLGLPGEEALALAPLPTADGAALFVARARSAKRGFEPDDVESIDALVTLLDGLPLAIELAAARVRVMPPAKLLERMGQRFKLLASSGGRRDRQATLRATLDWSWDLLSADEQAALAQVSVFEGGFTLDAAEAALALDEAWPMDAVQALVDKSLVRQVTDDRFDLLVSVQEYATERLAQQGTGPATEVRHGVFFTGYGTLDALDALDGHGGVALGLALGRELDNLVAGCGRAVLRTEGPTAVALLGAAWAVMALRGPAITAVALAERVVGLPGLSPREGATARRVLGNAFHAAGQGNEARAHFDAVLDATRETGDRRGEGVVLGNLGTLHLHQGRMDEAREHYDAALAIAREGHPDQVANRRREGVVLGYLGILYAVQGRMDEGRAHFEASLAVHREVGNRRGEGTVLGNLGLLHSDRNRLDEARPHYDASLAVAREVGDRRGEGHVLNKLGILLMQQGRVDEARAHYDASLAVAREVGDRRSEGGVLGHIGQLHLINREAAAARPLLSEALEISRQVGYTYGQPYWLFGLALLAADAGRLDEALQLGEEAVAVAAPYPGVQADALTALARVYLARGEVGLARDAIARARALDLRGLDVGAAAVEALVAVAEGDRPAAERALAQATADPSMCAPGTQDAQLVARARAGLEALDE